MSELIRLLNFSSHVVDAETTSWGVQSKKALRFMVFSVFSTYLEMSDTIIAFSHKTCQEKSVKTLSLQGTMV